MQRCLKGLCLALSALAIPTAAAGIVSTTGEVTVLATPPASVVLNALSSDDVGFAFEERTGHTLSPGVYVDAVSPGIYDDPTDLVRVLIPDGTLVNSYFVHVDNDRTVARPAKIRMTITFSEPIIGVMVRSLVLDASDGQLGAPGTTYSTGQRRRGYELPPEKFVISADMMTISIRAVSKQEMDQIRILTEVPEPSTLALLAIGLAGVLGRCR